MLLWRIWICDHPVVHFFEFETGDEEGDQPIRRAILESKWLQSTDGVFYNPACIVAFEKLPSNT